MNEDSVKVLKEIISEAKKKKKESDEKKYEAHPAAYSYDEAFDFSDPLGEMNVYAQQGAVNWGPYTSKGLGTKETTVDQKKNTTAAMKNESAWDSLEESLGGSPWSLLENAILRKEEE